MLRQAGDRRGGEGDEETCSICLEVGWRGEGCAAGVRPSLIFIVTTSPSPNPNPNAKAFGGASVVPLECGHRFHKKCLQGWLQHLAKEREAFCPYCKAQIQHIAPNPLIGSPVAGGRRRPGKAR